MYISLFFGKVIKKNSAAITCKNPVAISPYPPSNRKTNAIMLIVFIILNGSIIILLFLNFQKNMKVLIKFFYSYLIRSFLLFFIGLIEQNYFMNFIRICANQLSLYSVILSKTLSAFKTKSYNFLV